MNTNIKYGLIGALIAIGVLALMSALEFILGGFGMVLVSLVAGGYFLGRIWDDLFGGVEDDDEELLW